MMYTPQRKGPQSLRALAREKGKVVTCLPLPSLEEGKVQPPPMTPEEAIHAKALEVISGGGGEGVPSDGDIWRHFQSKGALDMPSLEQKDRAALQAQISALESEVNAFSVCFIFQNSELASLFTNHCLVIHIVGRPFSYVRMKYEDLVHVEMVSQLLI